MKLINIMKWKKISTWRLTYLWMTYIVPHFRYGALVFTPGKDMIREGKIKGPTYKFRRKLQSSIKKMYDFPKATSSNLIDNIMGNWRAEVLYLMNYARNANLWFDTFDREIL